MISTEVWMRFTIGKIKSAWQVFSENEVLALQAWISNPKNLNSYYTLQSGTKQIIIISFNAIQENCLIIDTKTIYKLFGYRIA